MKITKPKRAILLFYYLHISVLFNIYLSAQHNIPSFPGAEGFGAKTTGGRGGKVIYVTNLNSSGSGSFEEAVNTEGAGYILFKTSGLIPSTIHIKNGNKTIAGQTSPCGIIVRGFHYQYDIDEYKPDAPKDPDLDSDNMIIRHLRSRYADDAVRIIQTSNIIFDHCSFAWADDECTQISYTTNLTIQNCILGETHGNHSRYGGMLIVYSNPDSPLDSISVHHNLLMRLGGRLPEFNCYLNSFCNGYNFKTEFSNNLYWDPGVATEFKLTGGTTELPGGVCYYSFNLNFINNYYRVRPSFEYAMMFDDMMRVADSKLFISGNKMSKWPGYSDYEIINCCKNFHPPTVPPSFWSSGNKVNQRHPYPDITYHPADSLQSYMIHNCGVFPRDQMDRRFINYLATNTIDTTVEFSNSLEFGDGLLFDWQTTPIPPLDSDDDGMPDWWELHNGLDPLEQDHNGKELSTIYTGVTGYDNLECYINRLSDYYVNGVSLVEGEPAVYELNITDASVSKNTLIIGVDNEIGFSVSVENPADIVKVEISVDLLENPFAFPSPETVLMSKDGNTWKYNYVLRDDMLPGKYEVLIHAEDNKGKNGYAIIEFTIENPTITSLADNQIRQDNSILIQNYPNPFSSTTTISFNVPETGYYILKILDLTGREIAVLFDGHAPAGINKIEWNGTNNSGQQVSEGVYFYQLRTSSGFTDTRKMMLIR